MGIVAEFALYLLVDVLFYTVGRCAILLVSFGAARAETLKESHYSANIVYERRDGKIVISLFATRIIGIALLVALVVTGNFIHHL